MPLIKRYPNRKLYDTEAKRYVTLDDIAAMIREERDVAVRDHETGEDVTSLTLTQIILEQEKKSSGYLSSSLLTNLIRSGGATIDSFRRSLQQRVTSLGQIGRMGGAGLEEQIEKLIAQGKLTVEQAQGLVKLDDLLTELLHSLNVPTHRDIQTLQGQIESLSDKMNELAESQPPSKAEDEEPVTAAGRAPRAQTKIPTPAAKGAGKGRAAGKQPPGEDAAG